MNIITEQLLFFSNLGLTDKGSYHSYDTAYADLLGLYLGKTVNILEIGVGKGGSLLAWSKAFPLATVYGVDRSYDGVVADLNVSNIKLLPTMDQCDPKMLEHLPELDIIIEDASHQYDKSIGTFQLLKDRLKPGGIFCIEDVYPEFIDMYRQQRIFTIYDLRKIKNRQDDVIAYYTSII